jgi:hypothetical protein
MLCLSQSCSSPVPHVVLPALLQSRERQALLPLLQRQVQLQVAEEFEWGQQMMMKMLDFRYYSNKDINN